MDFTLSYSAKQFHINNKFRIEHTEGLWSLYFLLHF